MFLKWKKFIYKLIIIVSVLGFSNTVKADEINYNWVNCAIPAFSNYDNCLVGTGVLSNYPSNYDPWYFSCLEDTEKGITIYNTNTGDGWYLSYSNTAVGAFSCNIASSKNPNPTLSSCMSIYSGGTISGLGDISSYVDPEKTLYYVHWYQVQGSISNTRINNCNITLTGNNNQNLDDLVTQLEELNWDTSTLDPDYVPPDPNHLPFLKFGMSKNLVPGFPQLTKMKLNLTWDYTEKEVYANNPQDYVIEMIVSARFKNSNGFLIRDTSDTSINDNCKMVLTNGGTNISANSFSWIYEDIGSKLYSINPDKVNWGSGEGGYYLYVRIRNSDDSKSSDYKVFNCALGGLVEQENIAYDKEGNEVNLPQEDNNFGSDGVTPPQYSTDGSTSAASDPTSAVYDNASGDYNIGTLMGTLKSTVNQLGDVPLIFMRVFAFFPAWFLNLLVVSFGMVVVIGVVRLILK